MIETRTLVSDLVPGDRVDYSDDLWTVLSVDRLVLDLFHPRGYRPWGRVQIAGLWDNYTFLRTVEDEEGEIPL